jgi:TIR domain
MPEGCNPGCALYRKIDESDVFFLFWSTAAKQSEWMIKEVRYAIERHAGDEMAPPEIVPVMIEGPLPVAPAPGLKGLHFNDRLLYFIAGAA